MPLTPQDIVRREFREALRGYNQADVDLFLDEVVEEFTRLTEENQKLRVRLAAVQQEAARVRESRGGGGTGPIVAASSPGPDVERLELEVRARVRRFLEEQLRLVEAGFASPTVERIAREAPPPPPYAQPTGARQTSPVPRREPDPPPPPPRREPEPEREPEAPGFAETAATEAPQWTEGSREPFWAGE
jgi:DivIVA domain-containing protein